MPPSERLEHLRLEIEIAIMRRDWAIAEAERSEATPALIQFIKESSKECHALEAKRNELSRIRKRSKRPS